uniref:Transcription factor n=1 Tax=Triticum urartu TaxID=4572 RepID=A0A8R7PU34_TRIUA
MSWSDTDAALFAAVLGHDAARHLATTPPHLDGPASSSPELQTRLYDLVERGGAWTYGIYWQESRAGAGVLGWGDGHCRDGPAEQAGATDRSLARKRALLRLHALYGGGDEDGADYALRLDRVTGVEMYFLASMYFSFREDAGGPGRALTSSHHAWAAVDPHLPAAPGWYVRASLAQSAGLRTVVFLPCKGGVLELGSAVAMRENPEVLRAIQSVFHVEAVAPDDRMRIFGKDVSRSPPLPPVQTTGSDASWALRLGGQAKQEAAAAKPKPQQEPPKTISFQQRRRRAEAGGRRGAEAAEAGAQAGERAGGAAEPRGGGAAAAGEAEPAVLRAARGGAQDLQDGQGVAAERRHRVHPGAGGAPPGRRAGAGGGRAVRGGEGNAGRGGAAREHPPRRAPHLRAAERHAGLPAERGGVEHGGGGRHRHAHARGAVGGARAAHGRGRAGRDFPWGDDERHPLPVTVQL